MTELRGSGGGDDGESRDRSRVLLLPPVSTWTHGGEWLVKAERGHVALWGGEDSETLWVTPSSLLSLDLFHGAWVSVVSPQPPAVLLPH